MKKMKKKIEFKIDDNHTFIIGKYGPVIKCYQIINGKEQISFKPIKKDIDIHKIENMEYTIEEIVQATPIPISTSNPLPSNAMKQKKEYILGSYENEKLILRKGKFGLYVTWGTKSKSLSKLGNRPIENITMEEVEKYLS